MGSLADLPLLVVRLDGERQPPALDGLENGPRAHRLVGEWATHSWFHWLVRLGTVLILGVVLTLLLKMAVAKMIEHPIVRSAPGGFTIAVLWQLLQYLAVSGFFITLALTYTGGLQGTGDTRSPLFITLASQVGVPLGICFTLQAMGQLTSSGVWTAILLGHFTRCVLSVARFHQGKWKSIRVELK